MGAKLVALPPDASGITPMQMVGPERPPATDTAAPFSLTASDGSGLALTRIDAKAVVQGPLAFTELHLYFKNPESRQREGTFAITLPSGAAVSRFAMENNGQWQEAEVVEKQAARRIYDDFLHRKQDPALLEKGAGNQFTAKVFPIAANAEKHLVVSFSQELAGRGYVMPLRGLPKTDRVDVALLASQTDTTTSNQTLSKRDWQPDVDFVATVGAPAAAVSSGELVVGSITLAPQATIGNAAPRAITLLVDTSASRGLGFARSVATLRELIAQLRGRYGDALALQVVAFDQDTQMIFDGPAASYGDAQDKLLIARGAAGASDLAQALTSLASPHKRVVVVTDAVMTAGAETAALTDAIKKLPIERVDVVLTGGIRDEAAAARLVRTGLPQAGDVFDLDRGIESVASGLGEIVLIDIAIDIPGATWVYPRTIPAARPGRPLMVYARMARPTQSLTITVGGSSTQLGLGSATPALIERAIASAEIEEMESKLATLTDAAPQKTLRDTIAKESVRSRVISSQTSMIVLESEADYDRYKIPRTALADVLVIGPNGLEQQKRTTGFIARNEPVWPKEVTPEVSRTEQLARVEAIALARTAGLLGVTQPSSDMFGSVSGDLASGFDDGNAYGGLLGTEDGEADGGFSFGRSGFGPGGGGTGEGTIGTGRYGTIGHGSGTGSGYGVGGGRGGMRGRSAAVPQVRLGVATTQGDLDRMIIRRYMRRNIQKIQFCYEKELLARPRLAGTVNARFVIDGDGKVAQAAASGVDARVAQCVQGVILGIEFPRPPGAVQVTYPITFYPAGATVPETLDPVASYEPERRRGALTGKLDAIMKALTANPKQAYELAMAWHTEAPGDLLALVGLGEALEKLGQRAQAARIYGSIIDLFPMRADMRRFAGERLEHAS